MGPNKTHQVNAGSPETFERWWQAFSQNIEVKLKDTQDNFTR